MWRGIGMTYRHYGEYIETHWCEDLEQNYTPAATGAPNGQPPKCDRRDIKPGEDLPRKWVAARVPTNSPFR